METLHRHIDIISHAQSRSPHTEHRQHEGEVNDIRQYQQNYKVNQNIGAKKLYPHHQRENKANPSLTKW